MTGPIHCAILLAGLYFFSPCRAEAAGVHRFSYAFTLMSKRLVITLFPVTLVLYAWPMLIWLYSTGPVPDRFVIHAPAVPSEGAHPVMREEFINPDPGREMVHVGSICELPDGRLLAAWYGGTREGARDVAIFTSVRSHGSPPLWSRPTRVVDRVSASRELCRYVKKVGNPVVFTDRGDRIWLIYVTISAGGWSGSSLNSKVSEDGGTTWGPSRRLTLSPFFNISELVRNRPLSLQNGGFALPMYHECLGKLPEILWIRPTGKDAPFLYKKSRMAGGRAFIQPSVVAYAPSKAISFYRSCSNVKSVGLAFTEDTGITWSKPRTLSLSNPDSAVDGVLLSDHRILLAFNDSRENRENLRLAISNYRGLKWKRIATLENSQGHEYSYPYMIRTRDGLIHLIYTWRRKRIKHLVFNEAWINAQTGRDEE